MLATEIERIKNAKNSIKSSIEAKGVDVGNGTIDTYAEKINQIQSGGTDFKITNATYLFVDGYRLDALNGLCSKIDSTCTIFKQMFQRCITIATVPEFDTSGGTNFSYMFDGCRKLITVPHFNTGAGTNFMNMFQNCILLTTVPEFDTSSATTLYSMFYGCYGLTTVPKFNTSNVTDFYGMFYECQKLKTAPEIDTSKATNLSSMFYKCYVLTTVPKFNTSNVNNFNAMFRDCRALTTVPKFDFGKATNVYYMFYGCSALTNLDGFKDVGKAYTTTSSANYNNYKIDLSSCPLLTHDSLMNVINNLYDIASKNCKTQALILGSDNLAKLTSDDIAIATNKGFSVS